MSTEWTWKKAPCGTTVALLEQQLGDMRLRTAVFCWRGSAWDLSVVAERAGQMLARASETVLDMADADAKRSDLEALVIARAPRLVG